MNVLASLVLKASIIFAIAWLAAAMLKKASAALRHQVWAAAILCSLALPLLMWVIPPKWDLARSTNFAGRTLVVRDHAPAVASRTTVVITTAKPARWSARQIVIVIWAAGAALLLLRLLVGLGQLFLAGSRAHPVFVDASFRKVVDLAASLSTPTSLRLLASQSPLTMPLTWGLLRPKILLPSDAKEWSEDRLRVVLAHELAHIARHDWIFRVLAELACAMYWFHPLAWLAAASLREESERACDDTVLVSGVRASDYADELLTLARSLEKPSRAWSAALAMARLNTARQSNFERRLIAMLNPSMNRRRSSAGTRTLTVFASLCVLTLLVVVRAPGQGLAGNFSGTVYDPSGAVVPHAVVTLINNSVTPATKDTFTANEAGKFLFTNLPAGTYMMTARAQGFETVTLPQVTLEAGRDATTNVNLSIGRITQNLIISAQGTPRVTQNAGAPVRIKVGGNVQQANLIRKVTPIYPPNARAAGIEGTVELQAIIGKDGSVLSLSALSSSTDPDLVAAAKDAVSQWKYAPTKLNGEPVEVVTQISVQFQLHQ